VKEIQVSTQKDFENVSKVYGYKWIWILFKKKLKWFFEKFVAIYSKNIMFRYNNFYLLKKNDDLYKI
jgi:hypothetical protein